MAEQHIDAVVLVFTSMHNALVYKVDATVQSLGNITYNVVRQK